MMPSRSVRPYQSWLRSFLVVDATVSPEGSCREASALFLFYIVDNNDTAFPEIRVSIKLITVLCATSDSGK